MYFNADSLLNKRNELNMMIEEHPLVIGVTEMVPKNYKLQTQEVELGIENYKCFVNLKSATLNGRPSKKTQTTMDKFQDDHCNQEQVSGI